MIIEIESNAKKMDNVVHIIHHPKGWKHLGGSLVYKPSSVFDGHLSKLIVTVLILAVFLKNLASNFNEYFSLASGGVYMDQVCRQTCGELLPRLFILTKNHSGV